MYVKLNKEAVHTGGKRTPLLRIICQCLKISAIVGPLLYKQDGISASDNVTKLQQGNKDDRHIDSHTHKCIDQQRKLTLSSKYIVW